MEQKREREKKGIINTHIHAGYNTNTKSFDEYRQSTHQPLPCNVGFLLRDHNRLQRRCKAENLFCNVC